MTTLKELSLTNAQKGIWYAQELMDNNYVFNTAEYIEINGDIDVEVLKTSIIQMILESDTLRTNIIKKNEELLQLVNDEGEIKVDYLDFSKKNNPHKEAINWMGKNLKKNINVAKDRLYYEAIIRIGPTKIYWYQKIHHIAVDGFGVALILKRVSNIYNSLILGKKKGPKNFIALEHIINEEKQYIYSEKFTLDEKYWANKVKPNLEVATLKESNHYTSSKYNQNTVHFIRKTKQIPKSISIKLLELSTLLNVNWSDIILGVTAIYLNRTTNSNEVVLGVPMMCRLGSVAIQTPCNIMNILPISIKVDPNENLENLIKKIALDIKDSKKHERFRHEYMRREFKLVGNNQKLFGPVINFKTFDYRLDFSGAKGLVTNLSPGPVEDISVNVYFDLETREIKIEMDANSSIYRTTEVTMLINRFVNTLKNFLFIGHEALVSEVEILHEDEKNQIINIFNDTKGKYLDESTIIDVFLQQVKKNPKKIALLQGESNLTYNDLNKKSNQVANELIRKGFKKGQFVGVLCERSPEMLVGLLGLLKAGGVYIPINPDYPTNRISYILRDSGASFLLTDKPLTSDYYVGKIINLKHSKIYTANSFDLNITSNLKTTDLAYIIYTSGTTGEPNGVMVEHRSVMNFLQTLENRNPLSQSDVLLQKTSISFDASIWELFWWMLKGASLVLLKHREEREPSKIVESVYKYKVTHLEFSPSMLKVFLDFIEEFKLIDKLKSLKYVSVGGETLSTNIAKQFNNLLSLSNNTKLYNTYGPTETTVEVTSFLTSEKHDLIPIGSPNLNTKVYVLNDMLQIQPIGVIGKLYIAGVCLSRGYLNREALTKEKFIDNPHVPGERLYCTGDLGRWLEDGNLEYLGRDDDQVKIRGHRIELQEIEKAFYKTKLVQQAVITAKSTKDNMVELFAYYVSKKSVPSNVLKKKLSDYLPNFMIPNQITQIDKVPLTLNGKTDYNSLPNINPISNIEHNHIAPTRLIEVRLIEIWKDILDIKDITIFDNFFDMGGHSLNAAKLITKIHQVLDVSLTIKDVFDYPVLNQMEKLINRKKLNTYNVIPVSKEQKHYAVSVSQERMFLSEYQTKGKNIYNMPSITVLKGNLNVQLLKNSIQKLIERHESLRSYFELIDGEIRQKIANEVNINISVSNMKKTINYEIGKFVTPFELTRTPLVRVKLLRADSEKYYLLCDIHHIISDGISIEIMMSELIDLYNGKVLKPLSIQYKDYVNYQSGVKWKNKVMKQEVYWKKIFNLELPILKLPTDFERLPVKDFNGSHLEFTIKSNETTNLRKIAFETNTTMYMIVLAVFNIAISVFSRQDDITIGSLSGGRTHPDVNSLVGLFINTIAMRNYPVGNKTLFNFIKEIKENSINAFENQDYPLENYLDKLNKQNNNLINEIEILFLFRNIPEFPKKFDNNVKIESFKMIEQPVSDYSLILEVLDNNEELKCILTYSTSLYKLKSIKYMKRLFITLINTILKNPSVHLQTLKEEVEKVISYKFK